MDDLYSGVLLIVESARKSVAEYQDVHALCLKILLVVEFKVGSLLGRLITCCNQECSKSHQDNSSFHNI